MPPSQSQESIDATVTTESRPNKRFGIRFFYFLIGILFVGGFIYSFVGRPSKISVSQKTIDVDGEQRKYRLAVPHGLSTSPSNKIPVVIALHGALDTTDEMANYTSLDDVAHENGFLLVYLQGRQLNWPPYIPTENPDILQPDIRFLESVCDLMESKHNADPNRIYLVGVSQGGAMANALIAKCSERFAAAICNCGWLPKPLDQSPLETRNKCPMLFISGEQDRQVTPTAVRTAHDSFEQAGHPVTFHSLKNAGQGWNSQQVNPLVWSYLASKRLPVSKSNEPINRP